MKLDGYSQQFTDRHLEVGDIGTGEAMTADKAKALAEVFDRKIKALSRKPELSFEEERFLDHTADLSARNMIYALKVYGIGVPPETAKEVVGKAHTLTANAAGGRRPANGTGEPTDDAIVAALEGITSGVAGASIAEKPYLRTNVEDFASAAVNGFADMIGDYSGSRFGEGMTIDAYLAGNLQNMTAHYERAEAASGVEAYAGQVVTQQ